MTHFVTAAPRTEPLQPGDAPPRRDFALLWSSTAVSQLGNTGVNVAGPLLALAVTGSPADAGRVAAAATLPGLLLLLPAGVVVDRLNRRSIMIVSQLLRGAVATVLALAVLLGAYSITLLTLVVAAGGICLAFYNVAEISTVPQVVAAKNLRKAVATNEARGHAALLLGRSLGCVLYGIGRCLPFVVDAVACFISVGVLAHTRFEPLLNPAEPEPEPGRRGVRALAGELWQGLVGMWVNQPFRTALVVCTVTNLCFQAVIVLLVVMAREGGLGPDLIGVLLGASGLGGLMGAMFVPVRMRPNGLVTVAVRCAWIWAAMITLIACVPNPVIWIFAWGGVGFMGARMNIALDIHQARVIPPAMLGRVASANRFLSLGAIPLGACCGGYVIAALGTRRTAMAIATLVGVLALTVSLLKWRGPLRSLSGAPDG
jgi:MFS family permease